MMAVVASASMTTYLAPSLVRSTSTCEIAFQRAYSTPIRAGLSRR
jgi:hypothetical protein